MFEYILVAGVFGSGQAEIDVDTAVAAGLWQPEEFKRQETAGCWQ